MATCQMCGQQSTKVLNKRHYKYDNGETFVNWVCNKCSELHAKLLEAN